MHCFIQKNACPKKRPKSPFQDFWRPSWGSLGCTTHAKPSKMRSPGLIFGCHFGLQCESRKSLILSTGATLREGPGVRKSTRNRPCIGFAPQNAKKSPRGPSRTAPGTPKNCPAPFFENLRSFLGPQNFQKVAKKQK